jgi:HEAT repeat protein
VKKVLAFIHVACCVTALAGAVATPRPLGAQQGQQGRQQQGPADSLFRAGRRAIADENYRRAADLFARVTERYSASDYAADALYWRAYALFQLGSERDLELAMEALERQSDEFPRADTRRDARSLRDRIESRLADRGDEDAARKRAEKLKQFGNQTGCASADDDTREAALEALMSMNSEQAIPILKEVLGKRTDCSQNLRKKAVFVLSQKRGEEATDILLDVARRDPSREVRGEAIQWLGQSRSSRASIALDSILQSSRDEEIVNKAIFALSQSRDERSAQALRRLAQDDRRSAEVRGQAVFWLGQSFRDSDNMQFLRDLFRSTSSEEIRGQVLMALAQNGGTQGIRWLIDLARDKSTSIEARKNALFWAGQNGRDLSQLVSLYEEMRGQQEMQNQLIFVYSQRREAAATDKLMSIASEESNKELRKQAIFWLGQKKDPRVAKFLLDLINK